MTFPANRRITTRNGLLDIMIETHAAGLVARILRPEECTAVPRVTAAVGQDEDQAVEHLQAVLDGQVIYGHVLLPGDPDPPADGLPVFRFEVGGPDRDQNGDGDGEGDRQRRLACRTTTPLRFGPMPEPRRALLGAEQEFRRAVPFWASLCRSSDRAAAARLSLSVTSAW